MKKKKILVVEDSRVTLIALKKILENNGYEVYAATDGEDGLKKSRILKPDLILLDVMLPKIDGLSICRLLKFDETYASIPIIMLTAKSQTSDKEIGKQVGANAYITKPCNTKELLEKIEELISNKKRILIADDEQTLLDSLQRVLKKYKTDYKVFTTANSVEVPGMIEEFKVDILVTDILMPGKDGIELIKEVREKYPLVKIISMSGGGALGKEEYLDMAKRFGSSYSLRKPFSLDELISAIKSVVVNGESS